MRPQYFVILLLLVAWPSGSAVARTTTGKVSQTVEADAARLPQDPSHRLYDRIMHEFHRGDCEAARAGFQLFVELHASSPLTPYADYWSGECGFRLGRYREAIESFDRALGQSPLRPKLAAAAFLKKGLAYAKLGERSRSRALLELVVVHFPHTQQAALARQALLRFR
ncbi:MAG TPA: tetratricopeptide repeat protein [Nitrospiraceae bacterium]|jgi:TolA-binding protein|nr:tetratricopeptide repeat protein [Nitrospiraceae bacterium]